MVHLDEKEKEARKYCIEEGRNKERTIMVKRLLAEKMPMEFIAKISVQSQILWEMNHRNMHCFLPVAHQ